MTNNCEQKEAYHKHLPCTHSKWATHSPMFWRWQADQATVLVSMVTIRKACMWALCSEMQRRESTQGEDITKDLALREGQYHTVFPEMWAGKWTEWHVSRCKEGLCREAQRPGRVLEANLHWWPAKGKHYREQHSSYSKIKSKIRITMWYRNSISEFTSRRSEIRILKGGAFPCSVCCSQ